MSKKSQQKTQPIRPAASPVKSIAAAIGPSKSNGGSLAGQVSDLHRKAEDAAIEHADLIPEVPLPAAATDQDVREQVKLALVAQAGFEAAQKALAARLAEADAAVAKVKSELAAVSEQRGKLDQDREAWRQQQAQERITLAADRKDLDAQFAEVVRRESAHQTATTKLSERDATIAAREVEAATGFAKWRSEQSAKLSDEVESLRKQSIEHGDAATKAKSAWAVEEVELRARARREASDILEKARQDAKRELDRVYTERDAQAIERDNLLRRREAELRASERRVGEAVADLEAEVDSQMARERAGLQAEVQREQARREELEQALAVFREQADSVESWAKALGQDPASAMKLVKALKTDNKRLTEQLDQRPLTGTAERLSEANALLDETRRQLEEARVQTGQLRAQYSHAVTGVVELDTARREIQSYKTTADVLRQRLDDLQREVDKARMANAAKSPFEACSDIEAKHADTLQPLDDELNLKTFCHEVRHRLAGEKKLYFSDRVIRTFVAGMASSKLILLEGISGTGKTSLPMAMADVLGAGSEKVEVQAGWRDRQDLFGHYNTFERRFQETKFLKALVRAGTNGFKKLPMLVVLDEMNLSHPEQYFADVLSALEGGDKDPSVELLAKGLESAPSLLRDGKVHLLDNTWFIGTANQDETTKDFADKTYDRSHVMWLPRHHKGFTPERMNPRPGPLGLGQLHAAFRAAEQGSQTRAKDVVRALEDHLAAHLEKGFDVGWGNRLERQINAFVPVYLACGGRIGEAVDHIIFSKLIRKVRGRHDIDADDIRGLQSAVVAVLKALDATWLADGRSHGQAHDIQSLEAIDKEGKRLSQGSAWATWWEAQ